LTGHGLAQVGQHLQDRVRIRAVGGGDREGRVRRGHGELVQRDVLHDRSGRDLRVRAQPLGAHLLVRHRGGRLSRGERAADAQRVGPADQARRAILVGARSAEINRVNVVADALTGVLIQRVHRPAGRDLNLVPAELHRFHGGMCGRRGCFLCDRLDGGGEGHVGDNVLMTYPRSDSPEGAPAEHDSHYRATH
jgi:hypothetical protein